MARRFVDACNKVAQCGGERSVSGDPKKDEKIHTRTGIKYTFSATFMMTCQEGMLESCAAGVEHVFWGIFGVQ